MSKSLEALEDMISWMVDEQVNNFKEQLDTIKQDLELLEQLKQQRDSLAINNGELCVKVTDLQKENQELKEYQIKINRYNSDLIVASTRLKKENQELKEKSVKAVGFVKLLIDNISKKKLNDDRCSITNIKTGEEYGNLKEYITKMFNIIWDIEIKWLD